jgi:hypothetical protein
MRRIRQSLEAWTAVRTPVYGFILPHPAAFGNDLSSDNLSGKFRGQARRW